MNLKLTFIVHFLIGISIFVIKVEGLRCYVCGDDEELPCNDFDLKKDTYAKECVHPNNKGCEKQTIDRRVVLKCSYNSFNDCKQANGIEYCYCMTDLCNTNNMSKLTGLTDDEDFTEGEGSGTTVPSGTEKPIVATKGKSVGSKVDLYCSLIFIPLVAMLYNN